MSTAQHNSNPPVFNADEASETIFKAEKPSSIPLPTFRVNSPPVTTSRPPPAAGGGNRPKSTSTPPQTPHRFLTPTEWARVAHGVGAIREGETHKVVHPTCWYWPPKGLPEGLYRDVVTCRTKYHIMYQTLSTVRWLLMILQIVLGAILTALGSVNHLSFGIPITVLAVFNTVDAGLLAMMHNSGLPDRYRMDMVGFVKVEDFIKGVLDTGIVEAHQMVDDILCECFERFQAAKETVLANMPESYTVSSGMTTRTRQSGVPMICPDPSVHVYGLRSS